MFGAPATMPFVPFPPRFGLSDIGPTIHVGGIGRMDTGDTKRGLLSHSAGVRTPSEISRLSLESPQKRRREMHDFHTSDRVWAYEFTNPKGGFYAEYVAVDEKHVALVPRRLDLLHAGAATATGLTAIQGIEVHLRVRAVDTVLISEPPARWGRWRCNLRKVTTRE
jgi:NADPH:quinone reductase